MFNKMKMGFIKPILGPRVWLALFCLCKTGVYLKIFEPLMQKYLCLNSVSNHFCTLLSTDLMFTRMNNFLLVFENLSLSLVGAGSNLTRAGKCKS